MGMKKLLLFLFGLVALSAHAANPSFKSQVGKIKTGVTVSLTVTNYLEMNIDGVIKKIALVQ